MTKTIILDKTYISKCGNTVKIFEKLEAEDAEGRPTHLYKGFFLKVIKGHELLIDKEKIHTYHEDGKWFNEPGGIHDLAEEK